MPAYRSSAEAEIREAVVERLRSVRPNARIIHEINASSYGNRIDVMAVDRAEIIAVEIKSERDKLDRLPDQLSAMRRCAHTTIAALHEKFLVEQVTNADAAHFERDGQFYLGALPECAPWNATWVFPERQRAKRYDSTFPWRVPELAVQKPLPSGALDMLWRDELLELCHRFSVVTPKRPTMSQMIPALRWSLSGADITKGICAILRARECIEADPAIELKDAA